MERGNFFASIPACIPQEIVETVAKSSGVRIERIVSAGQSSPEGFWYDQDENEWVMVLEGSARLKFADREEEVSLGPGDWIDIPAHVRHRVEWTDPEKTTVWLAVFYD